MHGPKRPGRKPDYKLWPDTNSDSSLRSRTLSQASRADGTTTNSRAPHRLPHVPGGQPRSSRTSSQARASTETTVAGTAAEANGRCAGAGTRSSSP